jgi:integrase
MAEKKNHFAFTEARIKALPTPPTGRAWWYDSKAPALAVCKTAAGSTSYYFYKWANGRPARMLLGKHPKLTVAQARDAVAKHMGTIAAGGDPQEEHRARHHEPTLQNLWKHWQLYAAAHKKPRSVAEDERNWKNHIAQWAGRRLGTIKKADVQALHSRIGTEKGIYAANRTLALLRAMLNKAEDIGHRGANPAAGVKMFREESRDRFLQPGEAEAFFRALDAEPQPFRDFFLLCLLTGARKSNVMEMAWADVDLLAGYWRIGETKANMPVLVPLVAPALAILRARRETANGARWVFPGRRPGDHLRHPERSWSEICTRAGLSDLRPHDLRRSLGSYMAGANVSLQIIGKMLGHRTPQATMIYSRLALDPVREAAERAATAMLAAGGQTKLLAVEPEKGGADNGTQE